MKKNHYIIFLISLIFAVGIATNFNYATAANNIKIEYKKNYTYLKKAKKLISSNKKLQSKINDLTKKIKEKTAENKPQANATNSNSRNINNIANLNFSGQKEIVINNNNPYFTKDDLNTTKGAWQSFSNLDNLNRAHEANALLNYSLMPTAKREGLTWNPTGWHNKRISSGWLYNRSHLIGYQLTGQNNNPKNLITGTRELNSPEMLAHEMDVAYYLKNHHNDYIRYRVTPIFRGNELLARGVEMEAQSIQSNAIKFNVYIFNVQDGVTLNYGDGTSVITN